MTKRLSIKLIFIYLLMAVFSLGFLNTYGLHRMEKKMMTDKKALLYNEAVSISSRFVTSYYKKEISLPYLTSQIRAIGSILNARIWLVSPEGFVISDTKSTVSGSINVLESNEHFLDETFSDYTVLPGILEEPMLSVTYRVTSKYRVQGYIVIHTPLSNIHEEAMYFIDSLNIALLVFWGILCLIFVYLYYVTIHPLKALNKAVLSYISGEYEYPLKIRQKDEFGQLANSLVFMASEISNLDSYQKKFIANISHDFRSPLTSIKGYAEALQDGTIPYEMKDKYLGIILFETERLNKLTTSLLELNKLENRVVMLEISTFDINHIIKKTAESFEGICNQKKITLNLIFSSKEIWVEADMGKIQQVLYNLIDNAIKFSHVKSSIKISANEKAGKVFVSVKDYGVGIPKESLKKIWERFYKTDSSRGKDKKGTGLGLSIAREIINAHNENINVISTEGVGTEFIFTLSRKEEF